MRNLNISNLWIWPGSLEPAASAYPRSGASLPKMRNLPKIFPRSFENVDLGFCCCLKQSFSIFMKSLTLGFSAYNWPVFIPADNLYILLHLVSSNIKDVYSWWVECCVQWVVTSRWRLWTVESMEQRRVRRTRLHTLSAHHRSLQPTDDDESRLAHVSTDLFDVEMTSRTGDVLHHYQWLLCVS